MALMSSGSWLVVTWKPAIVSVWVRASSNASSWPMTRACQPNEREVPISPSSAASAKEPLSSSSVSWLTASPNRSTAAESQVSLAIIHCSASRAI